MMKKNDLTQSESKDIINSRLEIIKLVYNPIYPVLDAINKAIEIEDYILGRKTPVKDKVKV